MYIYMVSFPMKMRGGSYFSGPVRGLLRMAHMRGVAIRDFPGWTPVPISCPTGKCRTKSITVSLRNCHREVCRIKFYQIVASDVLAPL